MSKKYFEMSYDELFNLDREGIKKAYRGHNIDVEDTYKLFQKVKAF